MTKFRFFQCAVLVVIIAFCAFAQPALAQPPRIPQVRALPSAPSTGARPETGPTANLYALTAAFTATAYPTVNSDGTDLWPCFGSNSVNTDCPTIGNPSITFPNGGVALGVPSYVWSYTNCDGDTATSLPCGQTETFYEDDSNDSTDDLIYEIVVTQGSNTVLDSGWVDFVGANPYGGLTPPADVVIYGDSNFGTLGATGTNNGNCTADYNYPLASNPPTAYPYIVAANKTCVNPVPGTATLTAITELATPKYTKSTKVSVCGTVGPPCWTVKFTKKYSVTQKWTIWLE